MVGKQNTIQHLSEEQQARSRFAVAASGFTMADGLSQDPLLAQVRLRNGETVYVKDLPVIDRDDPQPNGDYQIALVNDHTGKVEDQGGASWLFVEDDMLHSLTLYSDNNVGNELLPLAEDGVLQFSTEGFIDENDIDADGKYGDFWITTLAPVTVGNDPGTQVLNGNKVLITNAFRSETKGEKVATKTVEKKKTASKKTTSKENEVTPEERESIIEEAVAKAVEAIQGEEEEIVENEVEETETEETEEETEEESDEEEEETEEEEKEEKVATNKVSTTPKARVVNATPKQPTVKVKNAMNSDAAMGAYANAIKQALDDHSGKAGVRAAMNIWKAANKITGDAIVPEKIAATFFKAWLDNESLAFARFMNSKAGAVYAFVTDDTAQGHAKTDPSTAKTSQELETIRRDLKALALHKKLDIDQQDIFDDESGELVKFRAQELSARINNQILVAALLGGTQEGSVASTEGGGTRGLFGIVPDSEETDPAEFGSHVASAVAGTAGEDAYSAVVRTIGSIVRTAGGNVTSAGRQSDGITLFVPWAAGGESWITKLLLTQNEQEQYLFPAGSNLEALLRISRIIEVPELAASNQLIAVADGAYQLYGENNPQMYPFFDTSKNVDVLLAEQFIAGSLAGYKQAAVYTPYAES